MALRSFAHATTYYIDYAGGSDSNNGTSTATPWKRHPYMKGWTGTYAHQAGDQFIFKGGVTWPSSCFPMSIGVGGNSTTSDYYGVNTSWPASWSRPIFDAEHGNKTFVSINADYVTLDNFEMTNFYWSATTGGYGLSYVSFGAQKYVVLRNCYFHGWSHSTGSTYDSSGQNCVNSATSVCDDLDVLLAPGSNSIPDEGNVVENCIFDGETAGRDSGIAFHQARGIMRNNILRNMPNGFLPVSRNSVYTGNTMGPFYDSFAKRHPNAIEQNGGGTITIYNNVIFGTLGITIFVGNPGDLAYIFNNIIYQSSPTPIKIDGRGSGITAYVFNNTINDSSSRSTDITGSGGTVISANNFVFSGTSADYPFSQLYAPANASAASVNTGSNLSSYCAANMAGPEACKDRLGNVRGMGGAWDKGAYEYGGVTLPPTATHPGDSDSDSKISQQEATKYGSCWKKVGMTPYPSDCPSGANVDYASRAGMLYISTDDGRYAYNSAKACPTCWEVAP